MLESLAASILNRFLGDYVENFDPKQLNIGIWSGDVKLKGLRLKKESLDALKLPVDVKFGHLGQLTLQIPWANLKAEPVKVSIEDVYLLATPILSDTYDTKEEIERELALKFRKLAELEIRDKANPNNGLSSEEAAKNESFMESLLTKITDNLQFEVKRIHLRYEDMENVFSEHPYAIGVTLDELSAVSTDENWKQTFISVSQSLTHKLLTMKSLCCYWNTEARSIYVDDHDKLLEKFQLSIINDENLSTYEEFTQFILRPVSCVGHLTLNKLGTTETQPHIKSEVFFEELSVDLDSEQYRDALWTASKFHWYTKTHRFKKFRPSVPLSGNGKEWFKYAANSVLSEIHDRNYRWSWEFLKKRRDMRKSYIKIWKRKLKLAQNATLSPEDVDSLRLLEEELSYEDIKFFRSLARNELRKETTTRSAAEIALKKVAEKTKSQVQNNSWLSWWSGNTSATDSATKDSFAITDEQRDEFFNVIEYDESKALVETVQIPRDRVSFELSAKLKRGGFTVRTGSDRKNLAEVVFDDCSFKHFQRPDSSLSQFSLQEFKVVDGTETTLYKDVISVKPLSSNAHDDDDALHQNGKPQQPFFQVSFENSPLDGSADSELIAKLKSMTIFYHVHLVNEIIRFFSPPKIHLETINAIMSAAEATVEGLTTQTRMGLESIWENHQTINAKLDLHAPLIILPLDPTSWSSPCAVIDAGHIGLVSDLADKVKSEEIRKLSPAEYAKIDVHELNQLMYDKFNLHLQDTQILIGPTIKSTIQQLHSSDKKKPALILEKLDMKMLLELSILPSSLNLAKIKTTANLPNLIAQMNDYQYKIMMQLIDKCIPDFDIGSEAASTEHSTDPATPLAFSLGRTQTDQSALSIDEFSDANDEFQDSATTTSTATTTTTTTATAASGEDVSFAQNKAAELLKNQHMFELAFVVDKVQLLLSQCKNGDTMESKEIVDLVAERFNLELFRTNDGDMEVDLSLSTINVEDWIEETGPVEFKKLISSNNFTKDEIVTKKADLFNMKYTRNKRIVVIDGEDEEFFDQDVKLDLSQLKLVVTRKSLLTILNFILTTFTDPNQPPPQPQPIMNFQDPDTLAQQIRVDINLDSIMLVLNDEGIKLATIQLSTAHVDVLVLPETLKVYSKLGELTLHDDVNEGSQRDSVLRKLLSFDGNEMAEFTYETIDMNSPTFSEYQSKFLFEAGSLRINVVEEPIKKILGFLNKFQKMKLYFDNARIQAFNQVVLPDQNIKFDIKVKTPIIVFPQLINANSDLFNNITVYLGEFKSSNVFTKDPVKGLINKIECGLSSAKFTSTFHTDQTGNVQSLDIIDNLNMKFDIDHHSDPVDRFQTLVTGYLTDVDADLTESQFRYIYNLSRTLPSVVDFDEFDDSLSGVEFAAVSANNIIAPRAIHNPDMNLPPPSSSASSSVSEVKVVDPEQGAVDFRFNASRISLTLHNNTESVSDLASTGISRFTLEDIGVVFTQKQSSQFTSNFHISSLVVEDIRESRDSKFTEISPRSAQEGHQFSIDVFTEGPNNDKTTFAVLRVNFPKVILALDYLFSLKSFVDYGLEFALSPDTEVDKALEDSQIDRFGDSALTKSQRKSVVSTAGAHSEGDPASSASAAQSSKFNFTIDVMDTSLILLADPTSRSSEAVVFKIEQLLASSQGIFTASVSNVGMFLAKMDQYDTNRIRIIDDFSSSLTVDGRNSSAENLLTQIQLSCDEIIMRVSLNDIKLAIYIFNKAMELAKENGITEKVDNEDDGPVYTTFTKEFKRKLSKYAPTISSAISDVRNKIIAEPEILIKGESLTADINGFRLVIIGNVNELPVLDLSVNPFQAVAKNWSTELEADVSMESVVNIYNYAKSSWESLVDPWPLALHVSRSAGVKSRLNIEFLSKRLAELSLSSSSIALLSQLAASFSGESEIKDRGEIKPYKIVNETGFDVEVWSSNDKESMKKSHIRNGKSLAWEFQDWKKIRENLDRKHQRDYLSLNLLGSGYSSVLQIPVDSQGEDVLMLEPAVNGVHNRIAVVIKLSDDNVKIITLRSTVTLLNDTQIPIFLKSGEHEIIIKPNTSKAVPIDEVYAGSFRIKPHINFSFDYCEQNLFWKRVTSGIIPVKCPATDREDPTCFYFQVEAKFDHNDPLAKIYPHMSIVISPPLEIENLLPYDISYRIYDRNLKRDWKNVLKKGSVSAVHVVDLQHFLLLSIQPDNIGFAKSDFAIINSQATSDFKREASLVMRNEDGQILNIGLHYVPTTNNSAGTRVVLYAPYIVLNKTQLNLSVIGDKNVMSSKVFKQSENEHEHNEDQLAKVSKPSMFSFDIIGNFKKRALIQLGNSDVSRPISFDAIGQINEVDVSTSDSCESSLGVSVKEGEGKYKLSRVVTVAPRYVVKNSFKENLLINVVGSPKEITLSPGSVIPLYDLPKTKRKQVRIRFSNAKSSWSAPFNIKDIGQLFLKVYKIDVGQILLKIVVSLEDSSLFINIGDAEGHWPYSIRNFTDEDFIFYQKNPDLDEDDNYIAGASYESFQPFYYRIPPKSVMPYSWDYPAGVVKELILTADGRERHIQLAEIGNLRPMRLPRSNRIIEFNVVADGPTQSLIISNYDQSSSMYKLMDTSSSLSVENSNDKFKAVDEDSEISTQIIFKFEGLGISLINTRLQELCYVTARGIEVRLNDSELYQTASVKLKWLQIDNQLFGGIYPIILYPTVVPQSTKEMNNHPAFSGSVSRVKDDSHGVLFIKYATLLLQEMSLEMDEDFLYALLDFCKLPGSIWDVQTKDVLCPDVITLEDHSTTIEGGDVYFEILHLQPVQLNISFVRTERINEDGKASSQNSVSYFFNILTMAVGNVNDAPIRLNALLTENVRAPINTLIQTITTHYGQAFFSQIHKVIGSADLIGNPVGLFNNISSGVMDIFYEPYQGLVMNDRPQELGISVAKGGLSFVKKTVFGFSDSFAKVTGSIAKGLSAATLDREFQERRRLHQRRNKPKHALYGIGNGATSFFDGLSSGLQGVAMDPIQGANSDGTRGFFKGIGKGLIGLPTKTAIGIFDLANQVSEGIKNTTTAFDGGSLDRVRLPRYIGHDSIIKPYDERESQGQYWLKSANGGRFINEEYLAHVVLPGEDMALIVTYRYIILLSISMGESKWCIDFDSIRTITQETAGIKIGLIDSKQGPFIPIPDFRTRKYIYNKIAIAVNDYNKKSHVTL
ncbi:hypothetical protein WICPIJ_003592 [Wickerhamomyces pijperi]|uniref:Vacuolar protein sorting-associated protein n=1 Tax=Wickerhamomyces pijperi TaxID=599730 RepID=A0A9P8Q9M3_WICPI|nr:hypothetical protein WICPIJ_003592 [Wickerhamomyces pijperi]